MDDRAASPAPAACTGKTCQSCTAGVIADCVAVCCCPCGVVNILTLAFLRLPWAVARKCIGGRRKKGRLDRSVVKGGGRAEDGISEIASSVGAGVGEGGLGNDGFGAEDVWLELFDEIGHLGFGRVSFTGGAPFHVRGN